MPDAMTPVDAAAQAERIRGMYDEQPKNRKMHALVLGMKGMGKTSLAATCPTPVLIHSFDPGGTELTTLRPLIEKGDIIVDTRFENDDINDPHAYAEWEKEYQALGNGGFFANIGTYFFDGSTNFGTYVIWQIMKKEQRIPANMTTITGSNQGMRIQDWAIVLNTFLTLSNSLAALPCHTVMTGHLGKEQDNVTGGFIKSMLLPGQSKDRVPQNMPEVYVILKEGPDQTRILLTDGSTGDYAAVTRMGSHSVFAAKETPDIRALLKKANYPCEDLPPLRGE